MTGPGGEAAGFEANQYIWESVEPTAGLMRFEVCPPGFFSVQDRGRPTSGFRLCVHEDVLDAAEESGSDSYFDGFFDKWYADRGGVPLYRDAPWMTREEWLAAADWLSEASFYLDGATAVGLGFCWAAGVGCAAAVVAGGASSTLTGLELTIRVANEDHCRAAASSIGLIPGGKLLPDEHLAVLANQMVLRRTAEGGCG